MKLYRLLHWR